MAQVDLGHVAVVIVAPVVAEVLVGVAVVIVVISTCPFSECIILL